MKQRTLRWIIALAGLAALLSSAGCGGRRPSALRNPELGPSPAAGVADHADEAPRTRSLAPADYRLAPRDQVVFEMFNEPDVKTTQRLSSQGEMNLPLAGTVTLAGLTLREAEQAIQKKYTEGGYYIDPHVILSVAEYGSRYVTVLGQVNRPDRIELPIETSSIGLVEAITQAGGFTRLARTDAVQITRQANGGKERHLTVDVREFLGQQGAGEFQLKPGDVVFVPERVF